METIDFDKSTHTKTCTKSDLPKKTPLFDGRATRSQHQIFDPFLAVFTNSHVYPGLNIFLVISHIPWKDGIDRPKGYLINNDLFKLRMAAILNGWYANYLSSPFVWLLATYSEKMELISLMVL